jgi:hypothetical protein
LIDDGVRLAGIQPLNFSQLMLRHNIQIEV